MLTKKEKAFAMYLITTEGYAARDAVTVAKNGDDDYLVYTDDEAYKAAREYILDTVWAFNKSFLNCHSDAISEMDDEVFSKIQEMCESANKTILRLIDDEDHFVSDAIASDGRGHFLSPYDGEEHEIYIAGEYFYIYRVN